VELGIDAGAGLEEDLHTRRAEAVQRPEAAPRAVTEHILALADRAGYGAALIDAADQRRSEASVITWPQFARMVRAAARGLSRRGMQEHDTVGIFVDDAASHAVAVHAVRAGGAMAAPVCPAQTAADIAAQLKQRGARLLITSAGLAELAIQAAERCLVRQVFAFGDAEGTTPFSSLLDAAVTGSMGRHGGRGAAEVPDPDGRGGPDRLTWRDVVVAAPPCGNPDAYTSLLDMALAAGATIVAAPLPQVAAAVSAYQGTAAITPRGTDVPGLPASRVFSLD
jgi:acyl-CoA synthetase (AMP-forming)/AMP-acid ligase II